MATVARAGADKNRATSCYFMQCVDKNTGKFLFTVEIDYCVDYTSKYLFMVALNALGRLLDGVSLVLLVKRVS
jgi:hypothetical protein